MPWKKYKAPINKPNREEKIILFGVVGLSMFVLIAVWLVRIKMS